MRKRGWLAAAAVALGLLLWFAWDREEPVATPAIASTSARPRATPLPRPRTSAPAPKTAPDRAQPVPTPARAPMAEDTGSDEVAEVTVRVVDPRGQGGRMRPRCRSVVSEDPERISETTTVWRFTAYPGACSVQGLRRDGALPAWSEEVHLDLVAGQAYEVVLDLPSERTGGLGVAFEPQSDGMRVTHVRPGTPAEGLGLEPGDVIVEVDGLPTSALSGIEFQQVLAGPEGTAVRFLVDHGDGDEPIPYDIVRSFVER